jgi:hypothetical protein
LDPAAAQKVILAKNLIQFSNAAAAATATCATIFVG